MKKGSVCFALLLVVSLCCNRVAGQAEVSGWGNLRGIRVGGQLVAFTTAVGVYNTNFSQLTLSQREGPTRTSQYVRSNNAVTVGASLQYGSGGARGARGGRGGGSGFNYTITYTDYAPGSCDVRLRLTSAQDQTIGGIYYFLVLPSEVFDDDKGSLGLENAKSTPLKTIFTQGPSLKASATGLRLSGKNNQRVALSFGKELPVVVQQARTGNNSGARDIQVYFPIATGNTTAGQVFESHFTLEAFGDVETGPVTVTIDPAKPGRTFDGMGGNYRIQSPRDRS